MESLTKIKTQLSKKLSPAFQKSKEDILDLKMELKDELASRKEEFVELKNDLKKSIAKRKNDLFKGRNNDRKDIRDPRNRDNRPDRRDRRDDNRGIRDNRPDRRNDNNRDNRDDNRQDQRNDQRNFFERKKEYLIKTFEKIASPVKAKNFVSEKYQKFVKKIDTPSNRKLIELLPYVLLAFTVTAMNNKKVLRPLFDAFYTSKDKLKPGSSMVEKTLFIITEYLSVFFKGNFFTNIDLAISTLLFLLDDIPGIYKKLDTYKGLSTFTMNKQLAKNIGDLNEELIIRPQKEKQLAKERREAKEEQQKFREDMQKLYKVIADKANKSENINITMPRIPQNNKNTQGKQSGLSNTFLNLPNEKSNPSKNTNNKYTHTRNTKVHKKRRNY